MNLTYFSGLAMAVCLWLFAPALSAQSPKLDSLYTVLKNHPEDDTTKVNVMIAICYYEYTSNPEKNKAMAEEAIEISKRIGFTNGIGLATRYLGLYWWVQGNYDEAAKHGYDMVRIFESNGNLQGLAKAYGLLGLVHEELKNFDKAKYYHLKGLEINTRMNRKYDMAYNLNSLGTLHHGASEYDSAMRYYLRSLALRKEINDSDGASQSYNNLGLLNKINKKYPEALEYFGQALATAKQVGNKNRTAIVLMNMGEVLMSTGNYNSASVYLNEALALAKELKSKKRIRETYRRLTLLENNRENYKAALEYMDLEFKYSDSIFTEEKAKQIAELEISYETAKKEQTIQILERDKKIDTLWLYILTGTTIVILVGGGFLLGWQRYRARRNQEMLSLRIDMLMAREKELTRKYQDAITDQSGEMVESRDLQMLKKALDVVEGHLAEPTFGVETLAEELGMSRANLHKRLKAMTGMSPSDFIRSVRLKRAAHMLRGNFDNVGQVGYAVGFEDQSYFTKSFKKYFGVAPSDYARKALEPENELAR